MSRSRRKTPIFAFSHSRSERADKKIWHGRWRAMERTALAGASPEALDDHFPITENEACNVYSMSKDGRSYWSPRYRDEISSIIAGKGKTPQEREALKARSRYKWMNK